MSTLKNKVGIMSYNDALTKDDLKYHLSFLNDMSYSDNSIEIMCAGQISNATYKAMTVVSRQLSNKSASKPIHVESCTDPKIRNSNNRSCYDLKSVEAFTLTRYGYLHFSRCCAQSAANDSQTQVTLALGVLSGIDYPLTRLRKLVDSFDDEDMSYLRSNFLTSSRHSNPAEEGLLNAAQDQILASVDNVGFANFSPEGQKLMRSLVIVNSLMLELHAFHEPEADVVASSMRLAVVEMVSTSLTNGWLGTNPFAMGDRPWASLVKEGHTGYTPRSMQPDYLAWEDVRREMNAGGDPTEVITEYLTYDKCVAFRTDMLRVGQFNFAISEDMMGMDVADVLKAQFELLCVDPIRELQDDVISRFTTLSANAELAGSVTVELKHNGDLSSIPDYASCFVTETTTDTLTMTAPVVVIEATVVVLRSLSFRKGTYGAKVVNSDTHDYAALVAIEAALNDKAVKVTEVAAQLTLVAG